MRRCEGPRRVLGPDEHVHLALTEVVSIDVTAIAKAADQRLLDFDRSVIVGRRLSGN